MTLRQKLALLDVLQKQMRLTASHENSEKQERAYIRTTNLALQEASGIDMELIKSALEKLCTDSDDAIVEIEGLVDFKNYYLEPLVFTVNPGKFKKYVLTVQKEAEANIRMELGQKLYLKLSGELYTMDGGRKTVTFEGEKNKTLLGLLTSRSKETPELMEKLDSPTSKSLEVMVYTINRKVRARLELECDLIIGTTKKGYKFNPQVRVEKVGW